MHEKQQIHPKLIQAINIYFDHELINKHCECVEGFFRSIELYDDNPMGVKWIVCACDKCGKAKKFSIFGIESF